MVIKRIVKSKVGGEGGGIGVEVEDNNDFEDVKIIDVDRYISYINRPENDVVDHNYIDIFK